MGAGKYDGSVGEKRFCWLFRFSSHNGILLRLQIREWIMGERRNDGPQRDTEYGFPTNEGNAANVSKCQINNWKGIGRVLSTRLCPS